MSVLVGRKAPDFVAAAVLGDGQIKDKFQLSEELKGKYGWLIFYPLDFTFVCPTELIALDNMQEEFKKHDVAVIAISIDSQFTHLAWKNTPVNKGGIGHVRYPLVADINHTICQSYGVEHPEAGVALRGAFLIDKKGIVRAQIVNDLPIGRNMDELIRLVQALQHFEMNGEVCPAGWNRGKQAITATPAGIADFLAGNAESL